MADSVVEILLNELSRVVKEEVNLQKGVKDEIKKVKDELATMKAFLRFVDVQQEKDLRLKPWVEQVRDVAFEIEDVVDDYLLQIASDDDAGSAHNTCFRSICSPFKKWKARHQIGSELQNIRGRVSEIAERPKRYGYDPSLFKQASSSSSDAGPSEMDQFRKNVAASVDERQLVGIDAAKEEVVNLLNDGDLSLKVVSIVGMGGLGKTTLAKQIFRDMSSHFERRAFGIVSQTLKEDEFFKDLIEQLFSKDGEMLEMQQLLQLPLHRLKEKLRERLENERYLIVVDDVWKTKHWDQIKMSFPRNNNGSRVIVTTRMAHVANHSSVEYGGDVHQLQPLTQEDSWDLFCKRTFPKQPCPSHLEPICKDIVFNKCKGVPIAILAIGGLLSTKKLGDVDEWKKVQESLNIELEENPELEMTKKILSLSFDDLPDHLKPCYMYLCIFPEDSLIKWTRVIRLWIAEGFVAKRDGRTMEEDADSYLCELVNRSLIQIVKERKDGSGKVKWYRIHDFLRDIVLSKSKEERFVQMADTVDVGARRLCIHANATKRGIDINLLLALPQRLRSLLMFFNIPGDEAEENANDTFLSRDIGFKFNKLLSVLDLERAPLDAFPEEICTLLLLRYLCLRNTKISKLPKSIGNLERLEMLDLKYTLIAELPQEISMLHKKLRHLLISRCHQAEIEYSKRHVDKKIVYLNGETNVDYYFSLYDHKSCGVKVTCNIGKFDSLQKVSFLEAPENSMWMKDLGRLRQLRKLGLVKLRKEQWREVCSCISRLINLRSLMLQTDYWFELEDVCPPPNLQKLHLNGSLKELPSWVSGSSLKNLLLLKLMNTRLKKDPGPSLMGLPNLSRLELYKAFDDGIKMRVVLPGNPFPSLIMLRGYSDYYAGYRASFKDYSKDEVWEWVASLTDMDDMDRTILVGLDNLIPLASVD
ncbi:disease resistance protein RPM1-like [Abrus precatorius]|uniref:Disease resistance protein RPM1-like n=1 Tax=Abrus precatorius TaxID=3816 RepID=A0A8B8MMU3_ABRPR|nr:disease resistance protein RPM1-like [Abrus precatorius]